MECKILAGIRGPARNPEKPLRILPARTKLMRSICRGRSARCKVLAVALFFLAMNFPAPAAVAANQSGIEYGLYLSKAGNCMSCHTRSSDDPFAGGVAFETSFGTIYSTNITPDAETGIGEWTLDDFAMALRQGVRPDGKHLYPVFPYTSYTMMSDEEVAALFAYFQTLRPVKYRPPENDLQFPYSQRWALGMWKSLYFDEGRFESSPDRRREWNRGAYLVNGLAHCGMCHTPRNFLGAGDEDLALTGGTYMDERDGKLLNWSATNLTSAKSGLGFWSVEDIVSYLQLGVSSRAGVFGPMNEVVVNGTRHLKGRDLRAMAVYLKSLAANEQRKGSKPDEDTMRKGSLLYDIHCGTCHLPTGLGSDSTGPPLLGSPVTLAADPASLINVTLYGPQLARTAPSEEWKGRAWQRMDPYAAILDDEEAAALFSYVRNAWGNSAGAVTPEQVADQR
jgi:mono/diheme cytochrome c family protein